MGEVISYEGQNILVIYLNDDEKKVEAFVNSVQINQGFIKFRTNQNNIISIPICRVLKIKERSDKDGL